MKTHIFAVLILAASLGFSSFTNAAPLYEINITGEIVPDNTTGAMTQYIGDTFSYTATFDLDINHAISTRVNAMGYTVYKLDDGGNLYGNSASINAASGTVNFTSTAVEFEFNDNATENWEDPGLDFLNLDGLHGYMNGDAVDIIVLGFTDDSTGIDFFASILFAADTFDTNTTTVDWSKHLIAAGEFDGASAFSGDEGFGQFLATNVQVNEVPIPAAVWLFGSGLIGLIGIARRKKA